MRQLLNLLFFLLVVESFPTAAGFGPLPLARDAQIGASRFPRSNSMPHLVQPNQKLQKSTSSKNFRLSSFDQNTIKSNRVVIQSNPNNKLYQVGSNIGRVDRKHRAPSQIAFLRKGRQINKTQKYQKMMHEAGIPVQFSPPKERVPKNVPFKNLASGEDQHMQGLPRFHPALESIPEA